MDLGLMQRCNLRDLGGHVTSDGSVMRDGLVYRSGEIVGLDAAALDALAGLGLRTVFDLRTVAEQQVAPDELPPGADGVTLDVLADVPDLSPAGLTTFLQDTRQVEAVLGDGRAAALLADVYRRLVTLPSARRAYRELFAALADETTGPALFHCTAGKDRTGWAAASLLLLLGVPEAAVVKDFLAGNANTLRTFQPQLDAFARAGGDPTLVAPLFGVADSYLTAALDQMRTDFGDVEGYFTKGLGLDVDVHDQLRRRLLSRPS